MEVLKETASHLSNYEVLEILKGIKSNKEQSRNRSRNQLATITYQTVRYLEDTPCNDQTPDRIRNFLNAVKPFNLTKSEKLILLNICPKTALEIQLIVEDGVEDVARLTEEEVDSLLQVTAHHFEQESKEEEEGAA